MKQLTVTNLTFAYEGNNSFSLNDISFSMSKGEILLVIGESGCGKTTLLRHLKPAFLPAGKRNNACEILFAGKSISEMSDREQASKIGYVGQNAEAMQATDKVWHELAFGLESLGYPNEIMRRRVAEMTAFFGLEPIYDKPLSDLSGGQKQLVNLASVMAMEPELLILDEPTSQLDPIAAKNFWGMIERINRELGTSVIMTEHRLEEVYGLCDRVLVMDNGRILFVEDKKLTVDKLFGEGHVMYYACPAPARMFIEMGKEYGDAIPDAMKNDTMPLVVGEGKAYVEKLLENEEIKDRIERVVENNICEKREVEEYKGKKSDEKYTKKIDKGNNAIETGELWFRYEKDGSDVLKGCSMTLRKGEITAILGGNGTGKTTLLQVLSGNLKPYLGKIKKTDGKVGILPQNPQACFLKKTVRDELLMYGKTDENMTSVISEFGLLEHLNKHPYDLSGGEKQRLALAKLVLAGSDVFLLDEPGKGMDFYSKCKMGRYLKQLADNGRTILIVSHDVEFCARFADNCGLFFDGNIVSYSDTRNFFADNVFYTTVVQRMCHNVLPGAVLLEDLTSKYGLDKYMDGREKKSRDVSTNDNDVDNDIEDNNDIDNSPANKEEGLKENREKHTEKATMNPKIKLLQPFMLFLVMPVTVVSGDIIFEQKKFYFISLLLVLEALFTVFAGFEKKKPRLREIMVVAMMTAITVAGRELFYMLPNVKPVAALVIISGISFGGEIGFLIGSMSMFISNIFFGQGPWTPWQMFAMGMIGFFAGFIFKPESEISFKKKIIICLFGLFSVIVVYGGIINLSSLFFSQDNVNMNMLMAAIIAGMPFDLIHGMATFIFLFLGLTPLIGIMDRVRKKL